MAPNLILYRSVICDECSKVLEQQESLKPHFDEVHDGRPPG